MNHSFLHKQALIKDNICIAVIEFQDHDTDLMDNTFLKFDYDIIVDTCSVESDPAFGASWDGNNFNFKIFDSWVLGEDLKWYPPTPKPDGDFWWDEESKSWIESIYSSDDNR